MNKTSATKTALIALLFGFYGLLTTGCGEPLSSKPATAQPADPHKIVSKYISARDEMPRDLESPRIIVGKPMPDLNGNRSYHVSVGNYWLATPSQFMPSRNVVIDDIKYVVLIQEDGVVYSIFTSDAKFRDPKGLGVGSTYAELKNKYNKHRVYDYLYMEETFVDVGNGRIYYFSYHPISAIEDDEVVGYISLPFIPPEAGNSSTG